MNNAGVIVFDNLIAARGTIGGQDKVQAIKPESFVAKNARGGLRSVESFEEVGLIAESTAAAFARAFSKPKL